MSFLSYFQSFESLPSSTRHGHLFVSKFDTLSASIQLLHDTNLSKATSNEILFQKMLQVTRETTRVFSGLNQELKQVKEMEEKIMKIKEEMSLICDKTSKLEVVLDMLLEKKRNSRIEAAELHVPKVFSEPFEKLKVKLENEFLDEQERLTKAAEKQHWRERAELEANRHQQFQLQMDQYRSRANTQAAQAVVAVLPVLPLERRHSLSKSLGPLKKDKTEIDKILLEKDESVNAELDNFYADS